MIRAANASRHAGRGGADDDDEDDDGPPTRSSVDEVEMGLLAHDEHASSPTLRFASVDCEGYVESEEGDDVGGRDGYGYGYGYASGEAEATAAAATTTTKVPLTREDKKAMALLIILCASLSSLVFHPTSHLRLPPCPVVADPPPPSLSRAKCCVMHSCVFVSAVRYHPGRSGELLSSAHTTGTSCVPAHWHGGRSFLLLLTVAYLATFYYSKLGLAMGACVSMVYPYHVFCLQAGGATLRVELKLPFVC